ncbi:hypothetical protein GTZ99_12265 [Novosphingobium sp. FSY-8]|uniref:Antitoxin ParD1/3/4 n=1 Tax=Novosphingobium ovatum TaxID=1908523 RepID=A0ABW9XFP9_9SPHN|nr:hypothetical protein [Novosphingobium ovatum]NBC37324.1 hypothetical protein [Novosphingobium ovatum]
MTTPDPITIRARELFIAAQPRGLVVERAARNGAYDGGSYIRDYMDEARRQIEAEAKGGRGK